MKDKTKNKIRIIIGIVFAAAVLSAGCRNEKTDGLKEMELGQAGEELSTEGDEQAAEDAKEQGEAVAVFVYVCGAVETPGVYKLDSDSRVYEAIEKAGGVTQAAAGEALNHARIIVDGERIYVPTTEELEKGIVDGSLPEVTGTDNQTEGKININTALSEELKMLPGIGDAKAGSIISYREENGAFQSIEELMMVEGIKEGVFNKIKDNITF
jgi:competence protein ComEA